MKTTVLLLLLPFTLFAQDFEDAPVLSAAAILKPEFAASVRDPVPTYGGRNGYMIDSEVGIFEADGNTMLVRRVREIAAIAKLLSGDASPMVQQKLSDAGITLATRLSPGALQ